jgi:hypothetical protein
MPSSPRDAPFNHSTKPRRARDDFHTAWAEGGDRVLAGWPNWLALEPWDCPTFRLSRGTRRTQFTPYSLMCTFKSGADVLQTISIYLNLEIFRFLILQLSFTDSPSTQNQKMGLGLVVARLNLSP